jgi:hypothetical protein
MPSRKQWRLLRTESDYTLTHNNMGLKVIELKRPMTTPKPSSEKLERLQKALNGVSETQNALFKEQMKLSEKRTALEMEIQEVRMKLVKFLLNESQPKKESRLRRSS